MLEPAQETGLVMAGQGTAVAGTAAPLETANAEMTLTALSNHMQSLAIFSFILQIPESMM